MTLRHAVARLPWGGSAVWESHIVWGTDVVWKSPQTWATHIVWGNLAEAPPGDQ